MHLAIAFINTATGRASLGRVARVNRNHANPGALCFVFDESAQLVKRPRVQSRSLTAASRYPGADARQILDGNPAPGVLRSLYDLLANHVVGIGSKAAFFAGKSFQLALSRACLFFLQLAWRKYPPAP